MNFALNWILKNLVHVVAWHLESYVRVYAFFCLRLDGFILDGGQQQYEMLGHVGIS